MLLNAKQSERYHRQVQLPEIGDTGQEALLEASVLIVGVGGLGSPAALYLAAAGVGTLGLMDDDRVELSNLQRQILYKTSDISRDKTRIAAKALTALNGDTTVREYPMRLTVDNAPDILPQYAFVLDATDNLESKFLIADACHAAGTPYSHAGICRFFGQTMTIIPGHSACYRCVFDAPPKQPEPPPIGPLGAVPGIIGSIQACEAIKHITGQGQLLTNRLLTVDALTMRMRTINFTRRLDCPLCNA
ncbi:MAG: HesA/MoeB/ThiF family protein [Kiritimatiellae bacterium]|nr:HesA/MoeB/ThiF family protein [Kiritimatiellia bacterium]